MLSRLPLLAALRDYGAQAEALQAGHAAGEDSALALIHRQHPRFLDAKVPWLPQRLGAAEIAAAPFDRADARLVVARVYSFRDWEALAEHVDAVTDTASTVHRFETAVEAVIRGDRTALAILLRASPELVRARSSRRTCHDPSVHRATLLHYLAANGVEGHRQECPPNAPEIAHTLLAAGAEVDALAGFYGGEHATLPLVVSSEPPARAGVQRALAEVLLDHGAAVDGVGAGTWSAPLRSALLFGYRDTARFLTERGASLDLAAAAALGRLADVQRLLASSDAGARHAATALAAMHGQADALRVLLDAGEDPNRFNPPGCHAHCTPLHQAALAGHEQVVELLLARGAHTDLVDTIYQATPLDWAQHGGQHQVVGLLRSHGSR